MDEADRIALDLLASTGVDPQDAAAGFAHVELRATDAEWIRDLRRSVDSLTARIAALPPARTIE